MAPQHTPHTAHSLDQQAVAQADASAAIRDLTNRPTVPYTAQPEQTMPDLAAPAAARTAALVDGHTQALTERIAHVLGEALPFSERRTGIRVTGGAHQPLLEVRSAMPGKLS